MKRAGYIYALAAGLLVALAASGGDRSRRKAEIAAAEHLADLTAPAAPGVDLETALAGRAESGIGLYVLRADGSVAAEVSPRPDPTTRLATPLASGLLKTVSGRPGGRLVRVRRAVPGGLTVVAERLLTTPAAEPTRPLALAALGVLATAAIIRIRPRPRPVPPAPRPGPKMKPEQKRIQTPRGESIIRLRESLGGMEGGPDLATCARSPLLRELSRCVRRGHAVGRSVRKALKKHAA